MGGRPWVGPELRWSGLGPRTTIEPGSKKCNALFGLAGYALKITYNFMPTSDPPSPNFARGSGSNPSLGRVKLSRPEPERAVTERARFALGEIGEPGIGAHFRHCFAAGPRIGARRSGLKIT